MAEAEPLSIGLCAQLACVLEVMAPKPGNVHRYADFADMTVLDFVVSAGAIAPVMERAHRCEVGETILEAVRATRRVTAVNTNLGIILLLAPLAAVGPGEDLDRGVARVLGGTDVDDARRVYDSIRLARPGGLGRVAEQDVAGEPTLPLVDVMRLAAGRDRVARQYVTGFHDVFRGTEVLAVELRRAACLEDAVVACYLRLLTTYPDSLIARKLGPGSAAEVSSRAGRVMDLGGPYTAEGRDELARLDAWLRADGNRRNPGTTADLVTASLFVALRRRIIQLPLPHPSADRPAE
jgi:triphosphoribosyl-dephospho-CoA synthase